MINKTLLEKSLNSFWWKYKEIFFEKSKGFKIAFLNWKFKTPSYFNLEWFSVLSRKDNREYFKVFSDFNNIEDKINLFINEYWISNCIENISLKWEENQNFKTIDFNQLNLETIFDITNKLYSTEVKNKSFITWIEISINLTNKSFIVANSVWNIVNDNQFYVTYFIKLIGERNWVLEEVYEKITWVDIFNELNYDNISKCLIWAINVLDKQLDWIPSPNWKIDVIIWNEAWWTIIHEAVWHWLEADLQNSSVYKDKIGQKVASELVTIVDNPTTLKERWYYEFDHEWNKSQNTILIEKGILKSYLHNEKTAQKFWVKSTSHWRKETYKHKTLVRMGNTYLLPWNDKKQDLISRVNYWVYVSRMWWWQVNTTTWDFVFKVQNWYLIENWKLTKNITWATLSWNWPEMLNEIYWVCDDLDFFDWGTCWKWQSMPVSDWTPTILTKLKVSWVN